MMEGFASAFGSGWTAGRTFHHTSTTPEQRNAPGRTRFELASGKIEYFQCLA